MSMDAQPQTPPRRRPPPPPRKGKSPAKPPPPPPIPAWPWLLALAMWGAAAWWAVGAEAFALLLLGGGLGAALLRFEFGFAAAWRGAMAQRDLEPVRGLLLLLALSTALFALVLPAGTFLGRPVIGAVYPAGVTVLAGALLFGIGMQIAGGCGSGCLYALGGGSPRMLLALLTFMVGGLLATLPVPLWERLPVLTLAPIPWLAPDSALPVLVQIAAFAGLWLWLVWRSQAPILGAGEWGALALAVLGFAVLLVSGQPWSITWGMTLAAAKLAQAAGLPLGDLPYWQDGSSAAALAAPLSAAPVFVTDLGLVLGAFLAAALAGRFAPSFAHPWRSWLGAALGGLLMGYGARLSFGCNIGALLAGIASMSLHGWVWLAGAALGSWLGWRARPLFALSR